MKRIPVYVNPYDKVHFGPSTVMTLHRFGIFDPDVAREGPDAVAFFCEADSSSSFPRNSPSNPSPSRASAMRRAERCLSSRSTA